jgi:hypothetical protein
MNENYPFKQDSDYRSIITTNTVPVVFLLSEVTFFIL